VQVLIVHGAPEPQTHKPPLHVLPCAQSAPLPQPHGWAAPGFSQAVPWPPGLTVQSVTVVPFEQMAAVLFWQSAPSQYAPTPQSVPSMHGATVQWHDLAHAVPPVGQAKGSQLDELGEQVPVEHDVLVVVSRDELSPLHAVPTVHALLQQMSDPPLTTQNMLVHSADVTDGVSHGWPFAAAAVQTPVALSQYFPLVAQLILAVPQVPLLHDGIVEVVAFMQVGAALQAVLQQ
jgi:hypothetical protein